MKREGRSRIGTFDGAVVTIIAVVGLAVLARNFVLDAAIVQGKSMLPRYRNGEVVLILRAAYGIRGFSGKYWIGWSKPAQGEVVAAVRPDTGEIVIKRVGEIRGDDGSPQYFLVGDNGLESIDSRDFGLVPFNAVIGKVFPQR